jgi:GNAT superfamily N-acetyltransferase
MSTIKLHEVTDRRALRRYIHLPRQLYRDYPNWVPPIYVDEWRFHDPKRNTALGYCETVRILAFADGKPVGRIMGIINSRHNAHHGEATARFFNLDCINDAEVSHRLINFIERWARERKMERLIGPFGFSDKDPQGLQIEGFEHLPVIATPTNPPYLPALVEREGYSKRLDCVSYKLPITEDLPPLHRKLLTRVTRHYKFRVLEFKKKKDLKPYVVPVFRLMNETYASIFGFTAMSENEMQALARQYMPVLDADFVKLVKNVKDELIGFFVGLPDMSRGLQKARGKLWPFGFLHLLAAAKRTKQLDLVLGAVKEEYRGLGVHLMLGDALCRAAWKRGFRWADSHLVLETNKLMCAEYENGGGQLYKRYRIYHKRLT